MGHFFFFNTTGFGLGVALSVFHAVLLPGPGMAKDSGTDIDYDAGIGPGRITYYDQSPAVACDIPQSEWPPYTAALDEVSFQGGLACGATANLFNEGKEVQVMIVDLCPTSENQQWCSGDVVHFDLGGSETFALLEPPVTGVKDVTFEWVPTPVGDAPLKLRYKDGVNAWWVALQVLNHRYPIANLEIKDPGNGEWLAGDRTLEGMWNYWQFEFTGGGLAAPYEIRITDQYGQVITAQGEPVEENFMWEGAEQFPLLPRHGGTPIRQPDGALTRNIYIHRNLLYAEDFSVSEIQVRDVKGSLVFRSDVGPLSRKGSYRLPDLEAGLYTVTVLTGAEKFSLAWTVLEN